jgi:hypothetical protein
MDATDNELLEAQYYGCCVVDLYMRSRTHLALGKDTPITRPVAPPSAGPIVTTPEVGGLHYRYDRMAA